MKLKQVHVRESIKDRIGDGISTWTYVMIRGRLMIFRIFTGKNLLINQ
jgi:hypothetical protein